jgi:hypothetical protein
VPESQLEETPVPEEERTSRRNLLFGAAAGALGIAAVSSLMEASPASAADGNAVSAGNTTLAEHSTTLTYDGAGSFAGVVFLANDSTYAASNAGFPAALGGWAGAGGTAGHGGLKNGIYGYTDNGDGNAIIGVNGDSAGTGIAVQGVSYSVASEAVAVQGVIEDTSPGGFSSAVRGQNNGTGGLGIGVWGSQAGAGWGVYATSVSGIGVEASGGSGTGVNASGDTGVSASGTTTGVIGASSSGTGVSGQASAIHGIGVVAANTAGGVALKATGESDFQGVTKFKRSGHVTIHAKHRTAIVKPVNLTSASLVLATVQTSVGVYVEAAVPHVSGKYFQIILNKAVPTGKTAKVAWFIVN